VVATYELQLIASGVDERVGAFQAELQDALARLGLHQAVVLEVVERLDPLNLGVVLYFGSTSADPESVTSARRVVERGDAVIPIVSDSSAFNDEIPDFLSGVNGYAWASRGALGLVHAVLEELKIEEQARRVFISHRRSDGLAMAAQVHDELGHYRFTPFVDRFFLRPGDPVQQIIGDVLEEFAFLLLLESPNAADSWWVFYEVEYALSHGMGLCIVSWPGAREVPGTASLRRVRLNPADLQWEGGYLVLAPSALDRVITETEEAHAQALVRRRQNLLVSVQETLNSRGIPFTTLPGWRLLTGSPADTVVGVASRLPVVGDLHALDVDAGHSLNPPSSVLVHAARRLRDDRRELLEWAVGSRRLTLVPENAVGVYW
jgi:hypothetical protein